MINPTPALTQLREWARQKQTDIQVPLHERALWQQIADEIDDYTGRSNTSDLSTDQHSLFGGA